MVWAHKWLGLIIGVQVVLWLASGLFMTAVPIETVRGEHNIRKAAPLKLSADGLVSLDRVLTGRETRAELTDLYGILVWRLDEEGQPARLVDAQTGVTISPLTEAQACRIAAADFSGPGKSSLLRLSKRTRTSSTAAHFPCGAFSSTILRTRGSMCWRRPAR